MAAFFINAYAKKNLGDELLIRALCSRYPEHTFYLLVHHGKNSTSLNLPNLVVVRANRLLFHIDRVCRFTRIRHSFYGKLKRQIIEKTVATINIGGSLFMQHRNWKQHWQLYEQEVKLSKAYFLLGCNFGPYTDPDYLKSYTDTFAKMTDVCFRDSYSFQLFKQLKHTRHSPDILLGLNHEKNKMQKLEATRYIAISVIDLTKRRHLNHLKVRYELKLAEVCSTLVKNGYHVKLLGFCQLEGDSIATRQVIRYLDAEDRPYVTMLDYKYSIDEMLDAIWNADAIIATRFHAMVFGWLAKIPTLPLIYSDKMINVINDIAGHAQYLSIEDFTKKRASSVIEMLASAETISLTSEIRESERHFIKLDAFMKQVAPHELL